MAEEYMKAINNIIEHCEVKEKERVLVLSEYTIDRVIPEALAQLAREKGGEVSLMFTKPFVVGGASEPSEIVRQAFFASELAITCSTFPIHYTKTLSEAVMEHQVRSFEIFGGMANRETLSRPSATMPDGVFHAITYYLAEKIFGEKEVHLTTKNGTDYTCRTPIGGLFMQSRGTGRSRSLTPGTQDLLPWAWEGVFWPRETGNGVVYFDGFYGTGYSPDPIICRYKDGWCTSIESAGPKSKADKLKEMLGPHKYSMHNTEFAVGVDPRARIYLKDDDQTLIEAERNCGTVHVANGSRRVGSPPLGHAEFNSRIHLDGTVLYPTVTIGGEKLIEDGVALYLNDPVLRDRVREFGDPDELLRPDRTVYK